MGSDESYGNNGLFIFDLNISSRAAVIASDGEGWEHVSIHVIDRGKDRLPTWTEMCRVKDLFWSPEDCVMQLHPAKSAYVNNHHYTLHLWRPVGKEIPTPPPILVGIL